MRDGIVSGDNHGVQRFHDQVTFMQGVNGVMNGGQTYFVDSARSASGNGKEWDQAFITISEAVAASLAASGTYDTILIKGTENQDNSATFTSDYSESVTIAATQIGLRIIGMGNSPEGVAWTVGTAEGDILTVYARDCYVSNIRFRPNGATSGTAIKLVTSPLMTTNPIGFTVENCIFRSVTETALAGISIDSTNDVTIRNNTFTSVATGILSVGPYHSVQYRNRIINNLFDDKCTNAIDISGRSCLIQDNRFVGDSFTTLIDTDNASVGSYNIITGHTLLVASAFETNCNGSATDDWHGNYCDDTGSSTVGTGADANHNYGEVFGTPTS